MADVILGSLTFDLPPAHTTGLDADSLLKPKITAEAVTLTGHILWQWAGVTAGQQIVMNRGLVPATTPIRLVQLTSGSPE